MPLTVPKEIEDEANSYFQRIYNLAPQHSLSIDEVLEMLKKFQSSGVKREKVIIILFHSSNIYFFIYLNKYLPYIFIVDIFEKLKIFCFNLKLFSLLN